MCDWSKCRSTGNSDELGTTTWVLLAGRAFQFCSPYCALRWSEDRTSPLQQAATPGGALDILREYINTPFIEQRMNRSGYGIVDPPPESVFEELQRKINELTRK